jgi:hypothetical protein
MFRHRTRIEQILMPLHGALARLSITDQVCYHRRKNNNGQKLPVHGDCFLNTFHAQPSPFELSTATIISSTYNIFAWDLSRSYLDLGRNMDPSMNTDPESRMYQQVDSSPVLQTKRQFRG